MAGCECNTCWLTLVVPRSARLDKVLRRVAPPDEDGEPQEPELKGVGRRLHWERTEDGWSELRDTLTVSGVPFIGFQGSDHHWPEMALVSIDGNEHYAAAVACEVVVALDLNTGEPQADIVAGMKEFIEFRKQAIETIRQYAPGLRAVGEVDRIGSRPVCRVTVTDPDMQLPVDVEIRKMDTGAMVGLDGSFLEQLDEDEHPRSPYDANAWVIVPDDETDEEATK